MANINFFEKTDKMLAYAAKHFKEGKTGSELPEEIAKTFERWTMAYSLLKQYNHMGREYVVSVYAIWLKNMHGIENMRTVREDLNAAPMIGYYIDPINREFKRTLAIERLEKQIAMAYANGERGDAARLEAILFKYIDPINDPIKIDDNDDIQNNFIIMPAHDPELLGLPNTTFNEIYKLKDKMAARKNKLADKIESGSFKEETNDLENEQTV
jgi:hypothetical protein